VLTWGGHIASQLDWGPGNGAGTISGSPYHMSQIAFSGPNARNPGNQALSLAAAAVTFPTIIVVNKSAIPTLASQDFNFTNTPNVFFEPGHPSDFVNSFTLNGSNEFVVPPFTLPGSVGENVQLLETTAFNQSALTRITEALPLPAGWTLTAITVHS